MYVFFIVVVVSFFLIVFLLPLFLLSFGWVRECLTSFDCFPDIWQPQEGTRAKWNGRGERGEPINFTQLLMACLLFYFSFLIRLILVFFVSSRQFFFSSCFLLNFFHCSGMFFSSSGWRRTLFNSIDVNCDCRSKGGWQVNGQEIERRFDFWGLMLGNQLLNAHWPHVISLTKVLPKELCSLLSSRFTFPFKLHRQKRRKQLNSQFTVLKILTTSQNSFFFTEKKKFLQAP